MQMNRSILFLDLCFRDENRMWGIVLFFSISSLASDRLIFKQAIHLCFRIPEGIRSFFINFS